MPDIVGYDPDKDYLLDPQYREQKTLYKCDGCGRCISGKERFFQLVLKKDFVVLCEDCYNEITECIAEDISYGN